MNIVATAALRLLPRGTEEMEALTTRKEGPGSLPTTLCTHVARSNRVCLRLLLVMMWLLLLLLAKKVDVQFERR